jgi:hypothetical protein
MKRRIATAGIRLALVLVAVSCGHRPGLRPRPDHTSACPYHPGMPGCRITCLRHEMRDGDRSMHGTRMGSMHGTGMADHAVIHGSMMVPGIDGSAHSDRKHYGVGGP